MIYWISAVFGAVFGSFANVCIFRLPAGKSIRYPASHCLSCGSPIHAYENIPVLSFFYLKGHCHACGVPISWQYPLVEICMAGLFVLSAWRFGNDLGRVLVADVLCFYLLTLSVIDFHHRIIPDELSVSLLLLGLAVSFVNPFLARRWKGVFESFTAGFGAGAVMFALAWAGEKIFKKEALGGGDVKLLAGLGALCGWTGVFGSLFFGSFLGAAVGVLLIAVGKKKRGEAIPFGPFLSIGAFSACFLPDGWIRLIFP